MRPLHCPACTTEWNNRSFVPTLTPATQLSHGSNSLQLFRLERFCFLLSWLQWLLSNVFLLTESSQSFLCSFRSCQSPYHQQHIQESGQIFFQTLSLHFHPNSQATFPSILRFSKDWNLFPQVWTPFRAVSAVGISHALHPVEGWRGTSLQSDLATNTGLQKSKGTEKDELAWNLTQRCRQIWYKI